MFPLDDPSPNFSELEAVLKGNKKPETVRFVEFVVDVEVVREIIENFFRGEASFISPREPISGKVKNFLNGKTDKIVLGNTHTEKEYLKQWVNFYYKMGYDYAPAVLPRDYLIGMLNSETREAKDTAIYTEGDRSWVEEGTGMISTWEDFKNFPWNRIKLDINEYFEFYEKILPEGMKVTIYASLFEVVGERVFGWENFFRLLYKEPDLVEKVIQKWGEIVLDFYRRAIKYDAVGGIFHADDLGYKKGTMIKPEMLNELIFPWFKDYASIAHQEGKMFWYHCCGNVLEVMDDLIHYVDIDAFHSFQDQIIPVSKFQAKFGDEIATLGGIDVDKLARMDEQSLREHVKDVLNSCMPRGRYALGAGNSITNYIPVDNYIAMLEEGKTW